LDRNKTRQERTEWHSVVVWGKRAEALNKILSKGSRIFIEGGLRTSSYDDRDGNKRYKTEIVANEIILAGRAGGGGGGRDGGGDSFAPGPSYDEPAPAGGGFGGGPDDDDIPF
jgi:single-strand DNA-binding protein